MTVANGDAHTTSSAKAYQTAPAPSDLIPRFVQQHRELQAYRDGKPIMLDGHSLSIAAVVAAARYGVPVALSDAPELRARVDASRAVLERKVAAAKSVYGVSTGLGGSADTRTNDVIGLGRALVQHHHSGVLPSPGREREREQEGAGSTRRPKPLGDPLATASMPPAWVRGAVAVRINSLVRGHSAVRWELLEQMAALLRADITPLVPLRGSISASGDLTPLAYVAGTVAGVRHIRVHDGQHGIKESLGIMNGTAFSAALGALALHDAAHLALLGQVCTALATEALRGVRANYDPFIHEVARPHAGQVEVARTIWDLLRGSRLAGGGERDVTIEEDQGELRQDRYTLRTAPQFLGPQVEDILSALDTVTVECNSSGSPWSFRVPMGGRADHAGARRVLATDNPLFNGETGEAHHGGNFQAMAVTGAMERTRLALHHVGKLLFAQATELMNPAMNRGLPPSLAASDPSLNYHGKGLDIAVAAYTSELGFLANPVSTHIQSAEMHNQSVNSLALISARATVTAIDVLSMLTATYLYLLCQALDLRAMQAEFETELRDIVQEELQTRFGAHLSSSSDAAPLFKTVFDTMLVTLDATTTMDAGDRLAKVAASVDTVLLRHFTQPQGAGVAALAGLPAFGEAVATRGATSLVALREAYLTGARGPAPASSLLHKTRPVYEYVRTTLGIGMHGWRTTAIRDGELQGTIVSLFG
ncbi:phenylalanine ammonia-lyase [Gloeopeniophorella convolvens]|nr:phenylalanine ammonia-lyase [Gloeopeniophorella convolvens]